jgi:hypothetical protein
VGGRGRRWGKGGEIFYSYVKTLYAHMNKIKIKINK